ncbi:MAG: hypothetical protein QW334_00175 [Thermofilum sp.]
MVRHPDFEKIYRQFINRYGEKEGEKRYYAWLNAYGLDDTKPMPPHLPPKKKESMSVQHPSMIMVEQQEAGRLYYFTALHAGTTGRPGMVDVEGLPRLRLYTVEELKRAARTLVWKGVNLNHTKYPPSERNHVEWAEYDDEKQAIVGYAYVEDEEINRLYDEGMITHCSVEYVSQSLPRFNGIAPQGIVFLGLAFLTNDVPPGDPFSTVVSADEVSFTEGEKLLLLRKLEALLGPESAPPTGGLPEGREASKGGEKNRDGEFKEAE